jgi:3-methyladenine DNA glycosylase AlkC
MKDKIEFSDGESAVIDQEDMKTLKNCLKQFVKIEEVEMPKIIKSIDDLETYVLKSLKNQLNDDNKKSQQFISKIKKNFEDLGKKIDAVIVLYGESIDFMKEFSERFENEDMERLNELRVLEERLDDEQENIGLNIK